MLHETTQRRVCRIAFLVGCVLPTVLVLAAVARLWMPHYAQRWELPLGRLLDCRVTIQGILTPTPGVFRFGRVVLSDPEVGTALAIFEGVTYTTHAGKARISVEEADVSMTEGRELGECILRLLRSYETEEASASFAKLTLVSGTESLSLSYIRAHYVFRDTGSRLQIWLPEEAGAPRLTMERNRQLAPPATRITFETGSNAISCRLLTAWDSFEQLGDRAEFLGRIEWTACRDATRGLLAGSFLHLSPSLTAAAADLPAQVLVKELRWGTGRPDSLGALPAGPVAAILAQLTDDERESAEQPVGEVAWELAPWTMRRDVATRIERDEKAGQSDWH